MPEHGESAVPSPAAKGRSTVFLVVEGMLFLGALFGILYYAVSPAGSVFNLVIFKHLFVRYDLNGLWVTLAGLGLGLACVRGRWDWARLPELAAERVWVLAGAVFVLLGAGAAFVYHAHPLSMDEWAPVFQARAFAAGAVTGQYPPALIDLAVPFGRHYFFAASANTGQVISMYSPGFALLLTPFAFLGASWLLNPLLGAASLPMTRMLCADLGLDKRAAGLAVLLLLASPMFTITSVSYYSMTAHLACNLAFTILLLRDRLFWAGLVGGLALILHNPAPHALYAAPWLVWKVFFQKNGLRSALRLAAGYLPLFLLGGPGWRELAQAIGTNQPTPEGVARAEAFFSGENKTIFSLPTAEILLSRGIGLVTLAVWTAPGLLPLAVLGWLRGRELQKLTVLALSGVTALVFYLFVTFDQGHGWGYRYYHQALFVLPILGAAALWKARDADVAGRFVVAALLCSLVLGTGLRAVQVEAFMDAHLAQLPETPAEGHHVVWIRPWQGFGTIDLMQNGPFLASDTLYLLSRGPDFERQVTGAVWPEYVPVSEGPAGEVWAAPDAAE